MINIVIVMGRITADPELRTSNSGISYCRFSVAVDRAYKSGDEKKTDFINCVAWRQTAEFISRYFTKGSMIALQGSLQQESYTDRDGNKRTSYTVSVEKASFTGSKRESAAEPDIEPAEPAPSSRPARGRNTQPVDPAIVAELEDDLPF